MILGHSNWTICLPQNQSRLHPARPWLWSWMSSYPQPSPDLTWLLTPNLSLSRSLYMDTPVAQTPLSWQYDLHLRYLSRHDPYVSAATLSRLGTLGIGKRAFQMDTPMLKLHSPDSMISILGTYPDMIPMFWLVPLQTCSQCWMHKYLIILVLDIVRRRSVSVKRPSVFVPS